MFATRRAYDFVAIACAHSRLKVRIFAGLPGLTTSYGGTHQAIEDLALMRAVPGLTVIDPCDATELQQIVPAIVDVDGPVYVRLVRGERARLSSIPLGTASSWEGPDCSVTAATSVSSARAS